MPAVLAAAGVYNLIWGAFVVVLPNALFHLLEMPPPRYAPIWQGVGLLVGVYGVGYLIAAKNPTRHWPIILVGLLAKFLGAMGFAYAVAWGDFPPAFAWMTLANDVVWWLPFAAILFHALRANTSPEAATHLEFDDAINTLRGNGGQTLAELSAEGPLLVLLPRHAGCTFCREVLAELGKRRDELEARGIRLAVVHMSTPESAERTLAHLGLAGVPHFADAEQQLYRAFELPRGRFRQLMGFNVLWRGAKAVFVGRHGCGPIQGDGFQLAGAFVLENGKIRSAHRQHDASQQPDFRALTQHLPATQPAGKCMK